ncbi:hypothetical protein K490DRAFT_54631 [Saccharata proteae CBS 121410]|uniref:Uncharacterized protein n=1 Tax=Saccharata proteae CBS 121410 TaxID=1314787 RepID=A0A9P4HW28_9PEZI|nr:hypothetical protein K490DRAFT_54631 [Saccharata proteae CBS 121410]
MANTQPTLPGTILRNGESTNPAQPGTHQHVTANYHTPYQFSPSKATASTAHLAQPGTISSSRGPGLEGQLGRGISQWPMVSMAHQMSRSSPSQTPMAPMGPHIDPVLIDPSMKPIETTSNKTSFPKSPKEFYPEGLDNILASKSPDCSPKEFLYEFLQLFGVFPWGKEAAEARAERTKVPVAAQGFVKNPYRIRHDKIAKELRERQDYGEILRLYIGDHGNGNPFPGMLIDTKSLFVAVGKTPGHEKLAYATTHLLYLHWCQDEFSKYTEVLKNIDIDLIHDYSEQARIRDALVALDTTIPTYATDANHAALASQLNNLRGRTARFEASVARHLPKMIHSHKRIMTEKDVFVGEMLIPLAGFLARDPRCNPAYLEHRAMRVIQERFKGLLSPNFGAFLAEVRGEKQPPPTEYLLNRVRQRLAGHEAPEGMQQQQGRQYQPQQQQQRQQIPSSPFSSFSAHPPKRKAAEMAAPPTPSPSPSPYLQPQQQQQVPQQTLKRRRPNPSLLQRAQQQHQEEIYESQPWQAQEHFQRQTGEQRRAQARGQAQFQAHFQAHLKKVEQERAEARKQAQAQTQAQSQKAEEQEQEQKDELERAEAQRRAQAEAQAEAQAQALAAEKQRDAELDQQRLQHHQPVQDQQHQQQEPEAAAEEQRDAELEQQRLQHHQPVRDQQHQQQEPEAAATQDAGLTFDSNEVFNDSLRTSEGWMEKTMGHRTGSRTDMDSFEGDKDENGGRTSVSTMVEEFCGVKEWRLCMEFWH